MLHSNCIRHLCCIAGALLFGMPPAARGTTWFAVDALNAASGLDIEVDTDSLRHIPNGRQVAVRLTYPEPRRHRWGAYFRSVVAMVEFRCDGGLGTYRDAVYYSGVKGTGPVAVREEGASPVPDRLRELLPPRSLETLTRAACAQPTPAAR